MMSLEEMVLILKRIPYEKIPMNGVDIKVGYWLQYEERFALSVAWGIVDLKEGLKKRDKTIVIDSISVGYSTSNVFIDEDAVLVNNHDSLTIINPKEEIGLARNREERRYQKKHKKPYYHDFKPSYENNRNLTKKRVNHYDESRY